MGSLPASSPLSSYGHTLTLLSKVKVQLHSAPFFFFNEKLPQNILYLLYRDFQGLDLSLPSPLISREAIAGLCPVLSS